MYIFSVGFYEAKNEKNSLVFVMQNCVVLSTREQKCDKDEYLLQKCNKCYGVIAPP